MDEGGYVEGDAWQIIWSDAAKKPDLLSDA